MKSPKELHERSLELLSERGVDIEQIADLVYCQKSVCSHLRP